MERIVLTNENSWFNAEISEQIQEKTEWDGQNAISKATGQQFEHETVYITASGKIVLCEWSQWQGTRTTYTVIPVSKLAKWLIKNEIFEFDSDNLSKENLAVILRIIEESEI